MKAEKIKRVTRIEMADNNNFYEVSLGKTLSVIENDGDFIITETGDDEGELFRTPSRQEALDNLPGYAIDDDLPIQGFGTHAGCKFWQLPEDLKEQLYAIAMRSI